MISWQTTIVFSLNQDSRRTKVQILSAFLTEGGKMVEPEKKTTVTNEVDHIRTKMKAVLLLLCFNKAKYFCNFLGGGIHFLSCRHGFSFLKTKSISVLSKCKLWKSAEENMHTIKQNKTKQNHTQETVVQRITLINQPIQSTVQSEANVVSWVNDFCFASNHTTS